ncbi:MAG: hypothetical protein JWM28_2963 [Chitinophagaceae bacterium]|nr:hypothetical protein [Chitinophagaceae bacterium]
MFKAVHDELTETIPIITPLFFIPFVRKNYFTVRIVITISFNWLFLLLIDKNILFSIILSRS